MFRGLIGRAARWLALGAVGVTLAACGGGSKTCVDIFDGTACQGTDVTTASNLRIALSAAQLSNVTTETITATITAVDDGGVTVSGAKVAVAVDSDAEVTLSSSTTGNDGKVTATIGVGGNRANRVVTLTASLPDSGVSRTATFAVTGAALTATSDVGIVAPGGTGTVTFRLVDASGNALAGEVIDVSGAGLPTATGTTGNDGSYVYEFTAPSTTGALTIEGDAAGVTAAVTVNVQADSSSIPVVSDTVSSATVSASPSVVSVNASATDTNTSTVKALFVGANNARIANVRVRFVLTDPNLVGGSLSTGSNVVYSDASGFATTTFRPAAVPSPTNGVVVRACWGYSDAELAGGACPRFAEAQLTVVSDALFVTIGDDELVGLPAGTYTKDFTVKVTDSAGRAKSGVLITPSLDLLGFYKGFFFWNGDAWQQEVVTLDGPYTWDEVNQEWDESPSGNASCPNEDHNRNGVNEIGEDLNGNGALDPAGVSIKIVGSAQTDEDGNAIVRIEYTRNRATWIDYRITVTASVSGSEGKAVYTGTRYGQGNLPAPGAAIKDENVFPAFGISPYGRGDTGTFGASAALCTNTN